VPIEQLTMYQRPTVKGRVVSKDTLREFAGRDGSTKKVFSIEIMDESCDMKATFWDKAVDKYYDLLEVLVHLRLLISFSPPDLQSLFPGLDRHRIFLTFGFSCACEC